jgi:predicted TPR repeat methyltransferase
MDRWLQTFFDVTARKPSGWLGKLMYRNPRGHYGFFRMAMEKLQLRAEDAFLEVGCGGGVLLDMALQTVQRACGIDHSPDEGGGKCDFRFRWAGETPSGWPSPWLKAEA